MRTQDIKYVEMKRVAEARVSGFATTTQSSGLDCLLKTQAQFQTTPYPSVRVESPPH